VQFLQPPNWVRPKGYSNGVAAEGRLVFTAGVVGWNAEERWETDDFVGQFRQALHNICAILAEGGAKPHHIVRMTWYVTSAEEYLSRLAETGAAYREIIGKHFPAMAVVQVSALMEKRAKVEIEATAVVPRSETA
jgi:enamine deaminase RidA (YjgF/YER057c/UK114 family)